MSEFVTQPRNSFSICDIAELDSSSLDKRAHKEVLESSDDRHRHSPPSLRSFVVKDLCDLQYFRDSWYILRYKCVAWLTHMDVFLFQVTLFKISLGQSVFKNLINKVIRKNLFEWIFKYGPHLTHMDPSALISPPFQSDPFKKPTSTLLITYVLYFI